MSADTIPVAEILDGITGSTPLLEVIGGRGTGSAASGTNDKRRSGHPAKYILDDHIRERLAAFDGTAAALNRLTDELGVPRNKLIDWLVEMGCAKRGTRGQRLQLVSPNSSSSAPSAPPSARAATPIAPKPQLAAPPETASTEGESVVRVRLSEWLTSGAEGVWLSGSICVHLCPSAHGIESLRGAHQSSRRPSRSRSGPWPPGRLSGAGASAPNQCDRHCLSLGITRHH